MELKLKPIPAFYCCYLLRSTVKPASLYVGSTPNPLRRLGQHNGGTDKGGAVRTSRKTLQPWEMTCIVTNFPSNIAALQFEWAWQNSHLTRKIPDEQRICFPVMVTKRTKRGRVHRKPARPRMSLAHYLSNLHLLLRVPGFARWPLEIRFFRKDVHEAWLKCIKAASAPLREGLRVISDFESVGPKAGNSQDARDPADEAEDSMRPTIGIEGIDPTYKSVKRHVEIGQSLDQRRSTLLCTCCKRPVDHKSEMIVICPNADCGMTSHVTCLAHEFLGTAVGKEVLPVEGLCPKCRKTLRWVDLVRELTLRMGDPKTIDRLMKRRKRKAVAGTGTTDEIAEDEDDSGEDDLEDEIRAEDVIDEPHKYSAGFRSIEDEWELSSVSSITSDAAGRGATTSAKSGLSAVVEDSEDWEGVEVLD